MIYQQALKTGRSPPYIMQYPLVIQHSYGTSPSFNGKTHSFDWAICQFAILTQPHGIYQPIYRMYTHVVSCAMRIVLFHTSAKEPQSFGPGFDASHARWKVGVCYKTQLELGRHIVKVSMTQQTVAFPK